MASNERYPMVLLASGGIDSFVAYHYLGKPQTIYFDICGRYSHLEYCTCKLLFPGIIVDHSLELGPIEQDNAHVPFRNLFFAMMAAARYSDTVHIAGIKDDKMTDKNMEFFDEISALLSRLEDRSIRIISPFWGMTKSDIVRWYLSHGGTKEELLKTVSCYSGEHYCGKCASCFRKWVALWSCGIKLEFTNEKMMAMYRERCKLGDYNPERNRETLEVLDAYGFQG
jgi:7-cyano-7-deazaguanine synthase